MAAVEKYLRNRIAGRRQREHGVRTHGIVQVVSGQALSIVA
jgi:hypothetical protein